MKINSSNLIIILLLLLVISFCIWLKKYIGTINNVKVQLLNQLNNLDKAVNIQYISELKDINVEDIDNNICTIKIKYKLNDTSRIQLLASLCKELNIKIKSLNIKDEMFLVCLTGNYYVSLMIDDSIIITCQNFDYLLKVRIKLLELLQKEFSIL